MFAEAVANGDSVEEKIDITDWLGGGRSTRATEQALGLGSYGKTLTVLTCPSVQNETYREHDTDDDEDVGGRNDLRGCGNDVTQQGLAPDCMQYLGAARFEPRSFARCHDDDCQTHLDLL